MAYWQDLETTLQKFCVCMLSGDMYSELNSMLAMRFVRRRGDAGGSRKCPGMGHRD